jgi:multiple sugar transport system permease protein
VYATRRYRIIGLVYLAPALLFVGVFTAYPFLHMVWESLTSWTLITPPKFIGLDNFAEAFRDEQTWVSLRYTFIYTLLITPILMVGGYLVALLVVENSRLKRLTRAVVFIPVVIGLGVSSLLWYWLYNPGFGFINKALMDLGVVSRPDEIIWLGTDAWVSTWAIIGSVTWKVIGFGMILFVAAIQAIPREVNEATAVDGAGFWQRTWRVTVPLTRPTILLVTLISVIGSLLAFDQFYILTKGGPDNSTMTIVQLIYNIAFQGQNNLGIAAALSVIVLLALVVINVVQLRAFNRPEEA